MYQLLPPVVDTSRGPAHNAGIILHRTDEMLIRQNTMSDGWCTQWWGCLRHCAVSRKVVGSIPDGVIGIFH